MLWLFAFCLWILSSVVVGSSRGRAQFCYWQWATAANAAAAAAAALAFKRSAASTALISGTISMDQNQQTKARCTPPMCRTLSFFRVLPHTPWPSSVRSHAPTVVECLSSPSAFISLFVWPLPSLSWRTAKKLRPTRRFCGACLQTGGK